MTKASKCKQNAFTEGICKTLTANVFVLPTIIIIKLN